MPFLSRLTHCVLCASTEHKAPNCPRREISAKAAARAAAKEARLAAAEAKKAAAKAKADAKRLAARAITIAMKALKDEEDAWNHAVYVALNALEPMPATAGNYRNSRWAVAVDVCVRCGRPPLGCMCI